MPTRFETCPDCGSHGAPRLRCPRCGFARARPANVAARSVDRGIGGLFLLAVLVSWPALTPLALFFAAGLVVLLAAPGGRCAGPLAIGLGGLGTALAVLRFLGSLAIALDPELPPLLELPPAALVILIKLLAPALVGGIGVAALLLEATASRAARV